MVSKRKLLKMNPSAIRKELFDSDTLKMKLRSFCIYAVVVKHNRAY